MVQRVCGTGIEVLMQAADAITHRGVGLALCVGTESMSRNPVVAYTHRGGFRMGQVEFKDFLWEALIDPAANATMGDTAENLARQYQITRDRGRRLRGAQLCARGRRAGVGLPRRRDRAGDHRGIRAGRIRLPRHHAPARHQGARPRHPHPPFDGRAAREDPPGVRRRADRRQFVGDRRRRGGRARGLRRLRRKARQGAARPHRRGCLGRACRRRSWASVRCRRSRPCWRRRA